MSTTRHVTLRRAPSFLAKTQGKEVLDFLSSAITEVGSYFEKGSKRVASGLNLVEEKLLLPELLAVAEGDKEYFKERNKFFTNLSTKIPENGLKLDISLTEDSNALTISDKNLPLNVMDYIRYRHALGHPWVAKSQSAGKGNQLKKYYIDDPVTSTQGNADIIDVKDRALQFYLETKANEEKVNQVLTLLGFDYRDIVGATPLNTKQLRADKFRSLVDTRANDINEISKDRNFDIKFLIQSMLNTGVLNKVGAKYLNGETGDTIGNYEETIEFFKDEKANSEKIGVLKARQQEASSKNKKVKTKKEVRSDR